MNKIILISFTKKGAQLNLKLTQLLSDKKDFVEGYSYYVYKMEGLYSFDNIKELMKREFSNAKRILFIGAAAIAVRSISSFLNGKEVDPAVLVMDERENYVISLLSGHLGGGNKWCKEVAAVTGAVPIITTATDLYGAFAVDTFALENHLKIPYPKQIKEISSRILLGKSVGFYSEFFVDGNIPDGLELENLEKLDAGICISYEETCNKFSFCCNLIPMDLVIGIGCRIGKSKEEILDFLLQVLKENKLSKYRIKMLCSIDRKAEEKGIKEAAKELSIPFVTYSKEQLSFAKGSFTSSDFVMEQVGIENVCERSAIVGSQNVWSGHGTLILPKQVKNGITIAIAKMEVKLCFM